MSTKEEWAKRFEDVHGRKPTPQEFMAAKEADFDISDLTAQAENKKETTENTVDVVAETVEDAVAEEPVKEVVPQAEPVTPVQGTVVDPQVAPANPAAFTQQPQPAGTGSNQIVYNLILPIALMVLSLIFAILAWFIEPGIIFVILAFLSLIAAIVSLVMSVKSGKKVLALVGLIVTAVFFIISMGGAIYQSNKEERSVASHVDNNSDDASDKEDTDKSDSDDVDSKDVNDYINKNYKFNWTESKFEKLKVKKDSVKEIIKTYGKASDAEMSGDELTLRYSGDDYDNYVSLNFKKQYDGNFVLDSANGQFDQDYVEVDDDYKSDWTQEQYDALKTGSYSNVTDGVKLEDVTKDHPKAYSAHYSVSSYREGEFDKELTVSYSDYGSDLGDKLKRVYLSFDYDEDTSAFYLTYKSSN